MSQKELIKEWVKFAENDLKDAEILFDQKSYQNSSWHCHQAIEKILKAIILKQEKRIRKIHDLIELLRETGIKLPEELQSFLEELNLYYLPPRYPDFAEQMKGIYRSKNIKKVLKLTKPLFQWLKNYLI